MDKRGMGGDEIRREKSRKKGDRKGGKGTLGEESGRKGGSGRERR